MGKNRQVAALRQWKNYNFEILVVARPIISGKPSQSQVNILKPKSTESKGQSQKSSLEFKIQTRHNRFYRIGNYDEYPSQRECCVILTPRNYLKLSWLGLYQRWKFCLEFFNWLRHNRFIEWRETHPTANNNNKNWLDVALLIPYNIYFNWRN